MHTYKNPRLPGSKDTRIQGYKVVWSRHPDTPDSPTRKPGACKCPKVQRYNSPHIQESKLARVQGYKGPRIQGLGLVPTSPHSRQPDPETRSFPGSKGSKVQEYRHTRIQGCQGPRIQGSKDTRLFRAGSDIPTLPTARPGNPELSRVQRFEGTRVHTYKNPRLPGSKDTRVQEYKVV